MVGHGSPKSNRNTGQSNRITTLQHQRQPKSSWLWMLIVTCLIGSAFTCADTELTYAQSPLQTESPSFRFRVSWGGGQNQSWQGSITASNGSVANVTPLGLDESLADTARVIDHRTISIVQKAATNYDGFDFVFTGDPDSDLTIQLSANDDAHSQISESLNAKTLIEKGFRKALDDLGNRLTVSRVPGDAIQVQFQQDHLVFKAGSVLPISLALNHTSLNQGEATITTSVVPARENGPATWSNNATIDVDNNGSTQTPVFSEIPLPETEGVYDLLIEVDKNWLGINNGTNNKTLRALQPQKNSLNRRVQFVVLRDDVQPTSSAGLNETLGAFQTIREISPDEVAPTGPSWRIQSQKQRLAVLGNQKSKLTQINNQPQIELGTGGWQAIRLTTQELGKPHIVEIEYPNNQPISLGLSILDQSEQGQVPLRGADSGVYIPNSIAVKNSDDQKTGRHRITFWPNSENVYLLLVNQSSDSAAQFGKITILAGPNQLPIEDDIVAMNQDGNRKRLAYYQSPSFIDDFGVRKFFDPTVGQSVDDWVAFYQGTSRLIAYLKSNHYQGAVVTVTAEGSSIYPDLLSNNTPAHDSGIFLSQGQDPFRKDVLRMMLKMFERENLTLVPAFTFSHPLKDIEAVRDSAMSPQPFDVVDQAQQVLPVAETHPRYNPLDENVQTAVLKTLRRFTERYREFSSLGGITLICQPNTYTMLPGSTKQNNPHSVNRFLESFHSDAGEPTEDQWVQWRADQMTAWYATIADLVDINIQDGQLFIAPVGLYETDEAFSAMCPNLHATTNFAQLMKRFGFDQAELKSDPNIVLLNPQSLTTAQTLSASRTQINAAESRQVHEFFAAGLETGTIFAHRGLWAHFAQLQSQAPFNHQSGRLLRCLQLTPAGKWNRQRYSAALNQQDSLFLIDGGHGLPQGQEEALQGFARTFAQLPCVRFSNVRPKQSNSTPTVEPSLAVRQTRHQGSTYLYAVNDSPWEVTVALQIEESENEILQVGLTDADPPKPASLEYFPLENSQQRQIFDSNSNVLAIRLPAFGIAGGKLTGPRAMVTGYTSQVDHDIEQLLRKKSYALQAKLNLAQRPTPLALLKNSGFEDSATSNQASWDIGAQSSEQIEFDNQGGYQSKSSLRLASMGTPVWIRSNRFSVPNTGRISVTAYLKIEDPSTQPPLRIAIEGETQSSTYYRFGNVGSLAPETSSKQIDSQWRKFVVHFDDLPTEGLRDLRIGFDLMGQGTVWIDDVAVHDRWFDGNDVKAITQLLAGAAPLMETPHSFESCRRILESYWPQFLDYYIDIEPAKAPLPETIAKENEQIESNSNDGNIFKRVKSTSPSLLRRWKSNLPQR